VGRRLMRGWAISVLYHWSHQPQAHRSRLAREFDFHDLGGKRRL